MTNTTTTAATTAALRDRLLRADPDILKYFAGLDTETRRSLVLGAARKAVQWETEGTDPAELAAIVALLEQPEPGQPSDEQLIGAIAAARADAARHQQLADQHTATRDQLIRTAMTRRIRRADIAAAAGLAESRLYQIAQEPDMPASRPAPVLADVTDPVAVGRRVLALIRAAVDTSGIDAPDPRSPYRDPVRQASWTAAGHLAQGVAAYEALPWQALAADLGGDLDDPDDAGQARTLLQLVDEHLDRARARIAARRTPPDWHDHVAVLGELEHLARRAADLRMVSMLEAATTEEVTR